MTWRWRFKKKKYVTPKIVWQHDAATIRKSLEEKPGNKFLECLLYLRLGYNPKQTADMAKVDIKEVYRHIRTYHKAPKPPKVKVPKPPKPPKKEKPKPPPFRFPEITGKQGTMFFLRREWASKANKKPWHVLFLIYLKTALYPRDHTAALLEIAQETGMKAADVLVILKAYQDGEFDERKPEPSGRPANRASGNETGGVDIGRLPLHLRTVTQLRRREGHTEEEK